MYTKEKVLLLMSSVCKGKLRAELLKKDEIRNAVLSSGANVTIYTGEVNKNSENAAQSLQDVYVGLIQRKNKKGKYDGLGALGGLAERTNKNVFANFSPAKQLELAKTQDDIIIVNGVAKLTTDIDIIRKNNVLREMNEELADLGITGKSIDADKLELISMPKVKDDNYMINIWDGEGECYAITPYCHIYKDETGLIDSIIQSSKEKAGGEVAEYKKVPILDALSAYGNKSSTDQLEDGRSATKDYRYPHEYLACWALASRLLNHEDEKMIQLAIAVQSKSKHLISFNAVAEATSQSLKDVAKVLHINTSTLEKMEKAMLKTHQTQNGMILSKSMIRSR